LKHKPLKHKALTHQIERLQTGMQIIKVWEGIVCIGGDATALQLNVTLSDSFIWNTVTVGSIIGGPVKVERYMRIKLRFRISNLYFDPE
jgi:hypothetical protein